MNNLLEKATDSAIYIKDRIGKRPEIAIILGSGLSSIADEITNPIEISYAEIPNFPISHVKGHENKLIYGNIYGIPVIAMKGRFHCYEGYTMQEATFPIKVFTMLGVNKLIVSNAAGAINKKFKPADLMIITDHLKMSGFSPLTGPNTEEFGERFPDMTECYSKRLIKLAKDSAKKLKIETVEGVYAYMPGPQYETPAELKMLNIIGADAVGMSTVPEVISAIHSNMEILGISCITNTTGSNVKLSHQEVLETAKSVEEKFKSLVIEIIHNM